MRATTRTRLRGFSLIELMIVVMIIGILAAIAVPAFRTYMYRSKMAEATTFLAEIRQRQEAYRAEFGRYAAVSGTDIASPTFTPNAVPGSSPVAFVTNANWRQLAANPDGAVYFQYATVAGAPGTVPTGINGFNGADFWFVSQARADLDGDGSIVLVESYSPSSALWIACGTGNPPTTPCHKGWE